MKKLWNHFCTITRHKLLVLRGCFAVGLYKQGILHDLSKYTPSEFAIGVRYYQGNRSPNNAEREIKGYSSAWLHHKGRNKHHYEYWIDYSAKEIEGGMLPAPMPNRYLAEMFIDRVAASKIYNGKAYTEKDPLDYYKSGLCMEKLLHPKTKRKLELLLYMLAIQGEKATYAYLKQNYIKKKKKIGTKRRTQHTV